MKLHTRSAALLTDLILEIFRLNGLLLAAGDELSKDLGLTSARWQVMGSLVDSPLTVSQIARRMGLTRQSVQRLVDVLTAEKTLQFVENPDHRRSKLVDLTAAGRQKLAAMNEIQIHWSNRLASGISPETLENTLNLLRTLRSNLQQNSESPDEA